MVENGTAKKVQAICNEQQFDFDADVVIGGADYHFIESTLLQKKHQSYSESYWDKRVMAPSSLLFYVGLNKKLENVTHHTLFFDTDFDQHSKDIYTTPQWPKEPLFYMSVPSKTDLSVAPENCENMFLLIPIAPGLEGDSEEIRAHYFELMIESHIQ